MTLDSLLDGLNKAKQDKDKMAILAQISGTLDLSDPYAYEVAATRVAVEAPEVRFCALQGVGDKTAGRDLRFLCVAVAAIACRRLDEHLEGRRLFDQLGGEFEDIPLLWHLRALSFSGGSLGELRQGVDAARAALERLPKSPGVVHNMASSIFELYEAEGNNTESLGSALNFVNRALTLQRRPRFLYTRARILRCLKRYGEAREDLVQAISSEDRRATDAKERIYDYTLEMALLGAERAADRLVENVETSLTTRIEETVTKRVEGAELRLVQTIAFVAAAIGFVQASVATLAGRSFGQAVAILGLLAGALFGAVGLAAFLMRKLRPSNH